MNTEDLADILQLIGTDGIGPVSFYNYVKKGGNVKNALELLRQKGKTIYSRQSAYDEIEKAEKLKVRILTYADKEYPQNLLQLNDAPPVLYVYGNVELLNYQPAISIVGVRSASINGRKIASRIAYDLTQNNVLVVSGMARGIDAAAHKGALYAQNQQGATVAVLGTGVDEIYPLENMELYNDICRQGAVISEFALGTKAQVQNFPRRNRIIAALSSGTLVVEAGVHSGSLITANCALEQGKDIFAVPGSPLEANSAGPNFLIKEGAILTENAEDILNILSMQSNRQMKTEQLSLALDKVKNNVNISEHKQEAQGEESKTLVKANKLIALIPYEGVDIDELLRTSNLSQADFFAELLELEFSGQIERQIGNKVVRVK
ncbi:MAG: DNA-processing protein DprA [Alphaproteobacteria bacterium]|nr:DNA-processing protein DprA [Alphaproteobacteria bacterium]